MGRQWDLMCGLSELESSLKTPFRFGIDPTVAAFAGAAIPVKMPSEGSENSIGVPRQHALQLHGSGIDPRVAIFASATLPVKRPSEGSESENSIEVPSCGGPACGCSPSCECKPECHCEGFAIDPNTVTLVASVAPPVMMPSGGSKKSVKPEREGIHPKLEKSIEAER
ncbi:uncharacterized protein LOC131330366 [Rhododendron vialii]|uniref:uncharacterized protein LOC131330366 n=1 Tax=Rhododendron vialii TaxID=182163 RepID=UPI00265F5BD7|nr:uncharacterized protein LOC131330366 [Rhododendron vialii]